MSGLRPWMTGEGVGSDDGDIVSHDSAGDIEDTKGALEMLLKMGPPSARIGIPDDLIEGVTRPEELAEIIVKTERIKGDSGSFYTLISEIAGLAIKKAIDGITGYVTLVEFHTLTSRVLRLERGKAPDQTSVGVQRVEEIEVRLNALMSENKTLRAELDRVSLELSQYTAGAREIYNSFQAERTVAVDPKMDELMLKLAESNKQRDEALKKVACTTGSSGGIARPVQQSPNHTHRRHNTSSARSVVELQQRFTPPLSRADAAKRFSAGER